MPSVLGIVVAHMTVLEINRTASYVLAPCFTSLDANIDNRKHEHRLMFDGQPIVR